ncbi:MFS transporter [Kitasatospora aburaviensis]
MLVAASFVNRVGNGLFNAASALYFTLVVGLPAVQVGAALTIAGVIGLCAGIPGGHLADRRGARTIMMSALAVQAVSMAALVLVESWAALTIIATVDQIAAAAGGAAWGALVVRVGGERPALFRAKLRTFVNLGVVLGTVGAGLALAANTRGAYVTLILGNAASFALCAVLLLLLPRYPVLAAPPQQRRWPVLADRPFLAFTALYGAMGLQYPVVSLLLPIWISEHTEAPRWMVAALFAVNSLFCVLMQTGIGSRIETPHDGGLAFRTAGLLFLVSCPMMALAAYTLSGRRRDWSWPRSSSTVWERCGSHRRPSPWASVLPPTTHRASTKVSSVSASARARLSPPRSSPRWYSASARQAGCCWRCSSRHWALSVHLLPAGACGPGRNQVLLRK